MAMIELAWLPRWKAYIVRLNEKLVGMVRCKGAPPFNLPARYV